MRSLLIPALALATERRGRPSPLRRFTLLQPAFARLIANALAGSAAKRTIEEVAAYLAALARLGVIEPVRR